MQTESQIAPVREASVFRARVAIVGFGTVGRSVARILAARTDGVLRLTCVCNRRVARKRVDWLPSDVRWTESLDEVLAHHAASVRVLHRLTPFAVIMAGEGEFDPFKD